MSLNKEGEKIECKFPMIPKENHHGCERKICPASKYIDVKNRVC